MNTKPIFAAAVVALALSAAGCSSGPPAESGNQALPTSVAPSTTSGAASAQSQSRQATSPARPTASHQVAAISVPPGVPMPNPALTPGAIQSSDTAAICTPGWAEAHRDVTGIFWPHRGDADRATSVAAAGVCLLGLAFGDPGKFLQAGGHVLV